MSASTGIFSLPLALSERTGRFVISAFTGAAFAFPFGIVRARRYGPFAQRPLNQISQTNPMLHNWVQKPYPNRNSYSYSQSHPNSPSLARSHPNLSNLAQPHPNSPNLVQPHAVPAALCAPPPGSGMRSRPPISPFLIPYSVRTNRGTAAPYPQHTGVMSGPSATS